ncbi:hypothetical protein PGTUg99_030025 [Puccinia graminis f. sp. tritici]|uniref:Uncharacterized protein n=1 Tax=Puccinia graminis f. sp. tritici TaxID=56615 RepID=A0A5B0RAQ0_PUCGR|nr:hypothetical protein PGTUg99_030025 [Puccinia graminis f. sp. tritici]
MVLEMKDWMRMFWLTMGLIVLGVEGGSGGRVVGIPFGCPTEARKMPFCFRRSVAGEDGNIASLSPPPFSLLPSFSLKKIKILLTAAPGYVFFLEVVQAKGYTPSYYCAGVQIANQVAEKRACCGTEGGGGRVRANKIRLFLFLPSSASQTAFDN